MMSTTLFHIRKNTERKLFHIWIAVYTQYLLIRNSLSKICEIFKNTHPGLRNNKRWLGHSVVVSLWDVTEPLYIEILRSDRPQKRLADVDLTHLKSYWVIHTISIAALGHSKSLWAIYFVSSHPKSSWVIKTSYVRGPSIQNPTYCDSVVTTTTLCGVAPSF